ncbi:MAG: tripartite tricarboxylate transporter substrate binding protein [Betaproteobacteria bacterium]|nr:tripartite tricarboxylate transporter substrate binding protein [Betaproteobacteria bacterium]MBI2960431.1 tripartite tricarboxylate transporter substrate binding protein [Betaproteobacteria bacterium]
MKQREAGLMLAAALALAGISPAAAQVFPEKPLRLIGASAAGGMIDIYARLLQPRLAEGLGQPVIIENRGGASGTVAESLLAKSAPDGYTMLMSADFSPANPHLFRNLGYELFRDLAPVSMLLRLPLALIVHPSVSAGSVAEFVAYVRSQRGKFAYASTGTGMSNHLLMVFLQEATGIEMIHVPYKGGAPAMADLVGNQVQASLIAITLAAPLVRSGKARAIGMTGTKRAPLLPRVPTFVEAGYANFPEGQWMGLFVPAGTPNAVIARLHGEFAKAIGAPEVQARLQELGAEAVMNSTAEFTVFLRAEHARLGKLIREHKIRAE